jgi:hypothetical protein
MLILKSFTRRIMIGRWCTPPEGSDPTSARTEARLHFHYALGFATLKLAHMLDSLVRVSRRARVSHFVRIQSALGREPRLAARADLPQSHPQRSARDVNSSALPRCLPPRTPSPAEHELTLTYAAAQGGGQLGCYTQPPTEICHHVTLAQSASLSAISGTL